MNPKGYRYGPYRVWGDLRRSRYFGIEGQPDITGPVHDLGVEANADVLGRSLKGRAAVRALGEAGHARRLAYPERLPLELRARLLPEERLEALLLSADEDAVSRLIRDESAEIAEGRRRGFMTEVARRAHPGSFDPASDIENIDLSTCNLLRLSARIGGTVPHSAA
jgi:hypothetical protein